MNHTPTPWHQDERVFITGPDENMAIVKCLGMDDRKREANAAFIVTACNAHERLVEALQASTIMLSLLHDLQEKESVRQPILYQLMINEAALAAAKGTE